MSATDVLVLVGGGGPDAPMAWVRIDEESGLAQEHGVAGAGAAVPATTPTRTILVLPGAEATVRRVDLPATTEAQARAALPHLFEGSLATSDGAIHYAIGRSQNAEGQALAAAMSAPRLRAWLDRCAALGADPRRVYLDFTVLPVEPGIVEVIETPRLALIAAGPLGGFSIEPSLAPNLFARWIRQAPVTISAIHLAGGDPEAWAKRLGDPAPPVRAKPLADPLVTIAQAAAQAPSYVPNLRQGEFGVAARKGALHLWRFAAVLALLAVILQIGSMAMAGWRDQQAADEILAKAEADFRAARPDVRRIVNLRAQIASLVNAIEQAAAHPVLATSPPLTATLQAAPAVRLDLLEHESPGRKVRVRLSATESAQIENLTTALRDKGFRVEPGPLQIIEDRYAVELTLESTP